MAMHAPGPARNEPAYHAKLPQMRAHLIRVAQRRGKVTYGDLMAGFELDRFNLRFALGKLGHQAQDQGEPILTAVVVNRDGHCSAGLEREFGVSDDAAERGRLYDYWESADVASLPDDRDDDSLESRARRFALVEVRTAQGAFRKRVFLACEGACVISGCSVDEALDAAHKVGKNWRRHNKAEHGYLLRKDLHALHDRGLLTIDKRGRVDLKGRAAVEYAEFDGRHIRGVVG